MKHIIKCSSGKDSEASIWWAYHNLPYNDWDVIFDDTEWESEEVYKHLKYLESRTGKNFINLRSTRFEGKNSQEILDKIIEIFGHRSIFAEMVLSRGRFPSTKGRFCTEELKIWPTIDFTIGDIPPRFCSIKRTVNVYRQDLVKLFGKKRNKSSATGGTRLFETDIKNPEEYLYQIWFKNDKVPVYTDEDGDEYILRNVRCPTIDDVVNYALKNPDQVNLFNKTGGCVSVYSICEVNPIN